MSELMRLVDEAERQLLREHEKLPDGTRCLAVISPVRFADKCDCGAAEHNSVVRDAFTTLRQQVQALTELVSTYRATNERGQS